MLIVCPNCTTTYQVDDSSIGSHGRSVRCARCKTIWFAPPEAERHLAPGLEPDTGAANTSADQAPLEASEEDVAAFRAELSGKPEDGEPPATTDNSAAEGEPEATSEGADEATADVPGRSADAEPAATSENLPALRVAAVLGVPPAEGPPDPARSQQDGSGKPDHPEAGHRRENIEGAAARRARDEARRRHARAKVTLRAAIVVLVAICGALIGWRKDVVRNLPQTASFYALIGMPINLRGLAFIEVKTGRETHDGVPVLVVEGTIASNASTPVDVPRLRFALRNTAGAEVYSWTAIPSKPALEPGQTLEFHSRLASPPKDGRDVEVRFFTHRDTIAGLH